jgi:7-cyano-7-deazaguanine synthase
MKKKSIVLLSGGLDSVVNFKKALDETEVSLVLTFDYGQKSWPKERSAAQKISEKYHIPVEFIELPYLSFLDTGLSKGNIPVFDENKLSDRNYSLDTAKAVWVPNRNGVLINIAAAYADKLGIDFIVTGFNKEEGATFPDNTPEFIEKINASLKYSTLYHPEVLSYTIAMDKAQIVDFGRKTEAPFEFVWSCYWGRKEMCGECESCRRLKRALSRNDFLDEFRKMNVWGIK